MVSPPLLVTILLADLAINTRFQLDHSPLLSLIRIVLRELNLWGAGGEECQCTAGNARANALRNHSKCVSMDGTGEPSKKLTMPLPPRTSLNENTLAQWSLWLTDSPER
jgi:hypothetical protein